MASQWTTSHTHCDIGHSTLQVKQENAYGLFFFLTSHTHIISYYDVICTIVLLDVTSIYDMI